MPQRAQEQDSMQIRRAIPTVLVTAALSVALVACGSSGDGGSSKSSGSSSAAASGSSSSAPKELRDVRYCEVIPSVTSGDTVTTSVFNTLGQNYCPPNQWNQLTEAEVNQEFGSQSAKLNGPRHFVIDEAQETGPTPSSQTFTFGGIDMGLRATLTTPAGQPTVGDQFYVPNEVQRSTIWTYKAGKPIFELVGPDGSVYVMQSYAQIADKKLTIKQLPNLASKLTLPAGWSYKSETPTQDLALNSNGLATVVNDNLYNSYQLRA
jgi:hypothetical protein